MDKELAKLEKWGVDLINNYQTYLKTVDPKSSEHKRIGRFSGELVANPEAYGELLEMARSKGMTGKQLVSSIRKIEQNLLDESSRGTSMSRKQLLSDVIHHYYAQRTGGDTLRRLSQSKRANVRQILRESFGAWGNIPSNLRSMARSFHLKSDALKGVELSAMEPLGITKAGQLSTPKAHEKVGKIISGTRSITGSAKEIAADLSTSFETQRWYNEAALKAELPFKKALDEIAGSTYNPADMSAADLAVRKNLLSASQEAVEEAFRQYLSPYLMESGSTRFNSGFGIEGQRQLTNFLKRNTASEVSGGLYSLLLDGNMRKAVEAGDTNKIFETLASDVVLGGLGQEVTKALVNRLPTKLAGLAAKAAPVLSAAAPIAAVSQLGGSVDPKVTETRNIESLEAQEPQAIERAQFVPQQYGKQGPEITPQGEIIQEPKPMFEIEDPLNELEYAGKQVMSFFGGALRMASPLGL